MVKDRNDFYITCAQTAIDAAWQAGQKILTVYETDFGVQAKEDQSPLTIADTSAHNIITSLLSAKFPDIPVLSEEGMNVDFEERKNWDLYWLIDPLDGTKEFIKRNGEFTVNIALITQASPVLGVIYVPARDWCYYALKGKGAFKLESASAFFTGGSPALGPFSFPARRLPFSAPGALQRVFTIIASRSHLSLETQDFIDKCKSIYQDIEIISCGSSLKICYIAEGIADVYPRFGSTMEWDIAAGQSILEEAGGLLADYLTGKAMVYNKKQLINSWFVASMPADLNFSR